MDTTQIYAIAAGSIFFCLLLLRTRRYIKPFLKIVNVQASQYLIYPQLIHRHRYLGPWSWADVLLVLSYIAINMFSIGFKSPSVHAASLRAADLSLINLVPALAGPHLSFLADIFGLSLTTYRRIHRSFGIMSCFLVSLHVFTMIASRVPFPLHKVENLWGLIVSVRPFFLLSKICSLLITYCQAGCVVNLSAYPSISSLSS
jgi:hypothetical protein